MKLPGTELVFVGDVYLPAPVQISTDLGPGVILNLEAPITPRSRSVPGKLTLRTRENHLPSTFVPPPLAVSLANNHVADYGPEGVQDTLDALAASGIPSFGAGTLEDGCNNPLTVVGDGVTAALLAYCSTEIGGVLATPGAAGPQPLTRDRLREDVQDARRKGADKVICCFHFGKVDVRQPRPSEVAVAREAAELGVDLVIGHHAHRVLPWERHHGASIFYGLGNCIFPEGEHAWVDGGTRRARLDGFSWTRDSLAVRYDLATGETRAQSLYFDGSRLSDRGKARLRTIQPDADRNPAHFRRALRRTLLRTAIADFVRRPRIPGAGTMRALGARLFSGPERDRGKEE